jgi:spermidine synthase
VRSLTVVELLPEVIGWHERGLVPLGAALVGDSRCRLLEGDFFRLVADPAVSELEPPGDGYGAILVDIDHAPDSWLHPAHASFYDVTGLGGAAALLREGGVFGFWSSGPTDAAFLETLSTAFPSAAAHEVTVLNPLIGEDQTDTIYVAR